MSYFAHSPFGKIPFNGNTYSLGHNESKPIPHHLIIGARACI